MAINTGENAGISIKHIHQILVLPSTNGSFLQRVRMIQLYITLHNDNSVLFCSRHGELTSRGVIYYRKPSEIEDTFKNGEYLSFRKWTPTLILGYPIYRQTNRSIGAVGSNQYVSYQMFFVTVTFQKRWCSLPSICVISDELMFIRCHFPTPSKPLPSPLVSHQWTSATVIPSFWTAFDPSCRPGSLLVLWAVCKTSRRWTDLWGVRLKQIAVWSFRLHEGSMVKKNQLSDGSRWLCTSWAMIFGLSYLLRKDLDP